MAQDGRTRKNLNMLQRFVPGSKRIVDQATFAAVYSFDQAEQTWSKDDIEGPLFMVETADERHALVVVNRSNTKNLVQMVGPEFDVDTSDDYLIFKCEQGIYGVWFPAGEDKRRVVASLQRVVNRGGAGAGAAPAPEHKPASFDGSEANFVLSKEQMKDVLLRLVQTDKFVDILHNTYLKSQQAKQAQQTHTPQNHPPSHQHQHQQHHQPQAQQTTPGAGPNTYPLAPSPLRPHMDSAYYGTPPMQQQPYGYPGYYPQASQPPPPPPPQQQQQSQQPQQPQQPR